MTAKPHQLTDKDGNPTRDRPWIFRTYAGHTSAEESNKLFRENLAKGQTGLSIAFDLPTQCGYSSDEEIAAAEVGKVGVPINSLDDFHVLFADIPLDTMNTSMTINGTSMWLLALYLALAKERGVPFEKLRGTTQNDIVKEYLARGTYIFPPAASLGLIAEMYEYCLDHVPQWNASNVCSYHLQEAGATPQQEMAFSLANAIAILDLVKQRGKFSQDQFEKIVGRISFFVNAGIRFVEETCKMRAFVQLWEDITRTRYGVTNPKYRRFRYGVQVNSLGLTEAQPENNAWRILLETLAVTLSRKARCRALQLPAWNEALSLPRPWDQQWSLRLQQILAFETDLLEYPDIFDGSVVIESKVAALIADTTGLLQQIESMGGVPGAIDNGYMKSSLVASMTNRISDISSGEKVVVGVNRFTQGIRSPLVDSTDGGIFVADSKEALSALDSLKATKKNRDSQRVDKALHKLRAAAEKGERMMEASIECALARVTTGEWAHTLREVFGEYRPATGIEGQKVTLPADEVKQLQSQVASFEKKMGRRPKLLVAKPGLDGHSNGAEMIAVAAKNVGFDVVYSGIRLTPTQIVRSVVEEDVHILGISILSGSHLAVVQKIFDRLEQASTSVPVIVGGIVPPADIQTLLAMGVAHVFTPSDYDMTKILSELVRIVENFFVSFDDQVSS